MPNNSINTVLVPTVFDSPEWEDKIELRSFISNASIQLTAISYDADVWKFLTTCKSDDLAPFKSWRMLPSGKIEFCAMKQSTGFGKAATEVTLATGRLADRVKHSQIRGFRDIKSAQANDKD